MKNPFRKEETRANELEALERATEGKPRFRKSALYEIPAVESSTERMIVRPSPQMSRIDELGLELKELEEKKKIMEIEKGLHHLMEEIHPSKRAQASKALKTVLGGVKENLKERHGGNVERREKFKKGIGEIIGFLKEQKAKREGTGQSSGFSIPAKYYEKALGSGWSGEKEEHKHKHHHKVIVHHKHHRIPYERMPRMSERMFYSRMRKRPYWEEF